MMKLASLADLERSHQRLEECIAEAMLHRSVDDLEIVDLKRQKLHIKEEIERLRHEAKEGALAKTDGSGMHYIITGTDSAGALSLRRGSAGAAVKKAVELMVDGCMDVRITAPDGRIYSHAEFPQLGTPE
jgi:hypothetical protein